MGNWQHFIKLHWSIEITACRRQKLSPFQHQAQKSMPHTSHTSHNTDLHNTSHNKCGRGESRKYIWLYCTEWYFLNISPIAQRIKATIHKSYLLKFKTWHKSMIIIIWLNMMPLPFIKILIDSYKNRYIYNTNQDKPYLLSFTPTK